MWRCALLTTHILLLFAGVSRQAGQAKNYYLRNGGVRGQREAGGGWVFPQSAYKFGSFYYYPPGYAIIYCVQFFARVAMLYIIGQKYGRLKVLKREGDFHLCQCECGTERLFRTDRLRSGKTKSCGCLAAELNAASKSAAALARANTSQPPRQRRAEVERQLASVWSTMKQRCTNPNYRDYKYYGARGIDICPQWMNSSAQFIADMLPFYAPGLWLERIDNDRGYSPDNCTFVTPKQQAQNRRPYGTGLTTDTQAIEWPYPPIVEP